MLSTRTISIIPQVSSGQEEGPPHAWIVRVEGHEFVHGHEHALLFEDPEEAAQFAADLLAEYGSGTNVEIIGLDALGIPLPSPLVVPEYVIDPYTWMDEQNIVKPEPVHPLDRLAAKVCRALFSEQPARSKVQLVLAIYGDLLNSGRIAALRRLDPEYVIATFKRILPQPYVAFAEVEAALRVFQRRISTI